MNAGSKGRAPDVVDSLVAETAEALAGADWQQALVLADTALSLDPASTAALAVRERARIELSNLALRGELTTRRPSGRRASQARAPRARRDRRGALELAVRSVTELRPLPVIAQRALRLVNDAEASAAALGRLIGADPALTARVLRMANSAHYRRLRHVATVREAVVVLGFQELREVVVTASLLDTFQAPCVVSPDEFWRFSLVVATLADLQARVRGQAREEAFTAGVLHNIGLLALDVADPQGFRQALDMEEVEGLRRLHDRERAVLGYTDAELGGAVGKIWNLPPDLIRVMERSGFRPDEVPVTDPLTGYVIRARALARSYGLSDGVEESESRQAADEWLTGPLGQALKRLGGLDLILDRVDTLLGSHGAGVELAPGTDGTPAGMAA